MLIGLSAATIICSLAIAAPLPPGAPTDGNFYTVEISENSSEGIASVAVGKNPNPPVMIKPNANGSYTLGVPLQPGVVTITDTGGVVSDLITLVANAAGNVNLARFFSDPPGAPGTDDTAAEVEKLAVFDGIETPFGQHSTTFIISSPAEAPEPGSLPLFATALLALTSIATGFRRRS